MQKGVISESSNTNVLKFLSEGESIIVGVPSVGEFVVNDTVSAYNQSTKTSVFLPVNVTDIKETLYGKVIEELWVDYNEAMTEKGATTKSPKVKAILDKINILKPQTQIYFGFKDVETGEDVILSMGINTTMGPKDKPKAGNNLMNAIAQCKDHLKVYPLQLTKGSMGAWSVMPYLSPLTDSQKENFAKTTDIDMETYKKCMYFTTTESEEENVRKFAKEFGFDLARIGLSEEVAAETEESNKSKYEF